MLGWIIGKEAHNLREKTGEESPFCEMKRKLCVASS